MSHDPSVAMIENNAEEDRLYIPANHDPEYSENLVLMGGDPKTGIAMYLHFSRMHGDPNVWEGVLTVYEKNGVVLSHRSLGADGTRDKASCGPLSFEVVEPLQKWRLRFDGPMIRTTTHEAAKALLTEGAEESVQLDLLFDGSFPTWTAGKAMDGQEWGHTHLEQGGRVTGSVTAAGKTTSIDFLGFRDHTRGPRNYSSLDKEAWGFGFFPDGRVYLVCEAWQNPGRPYVGFGFIVDNGKLYPATPVRTASMDDAEGAPHAYSIELKTELGDMQIESEVLSSMSYTMQVPIGIVPGADWSNPRNTILMESWIKVRWNGQTGYGWQERFNRVHRLKQPR